MVLENVYIAMHRMLLEKGTLKVLLASAQQEMRNVLLESGKVTLSYSGKKSGCIVFSLLRKKQNLPPMSLDIWLRRFLSKVLNVQPGSSCCL